LFFLEGRNEIQVEPRRGDTPVSILIHESLEAAVPLSFIFDLALVLNGGQERRR
jgi:hypothetical protein